MYKELINKGQNYSLLFVDDDLSFLDIARDLLENFFGEVYVEKNGLDGLESFKKNRQDIVITDITMPKMDGLEMAEKIREIEPDKRIVVISAHGDTSKLIHAIESGIDYFLLKPLDSSQLLRKLEKIVNELNQAKSKNREAELEKRLMQQSKMAMMGEMLAIITHQLKQPLSAIPLMVASHIQDIEDFDCSKDCLNSALELDKKIDNQIEHMVSTISHFSNFLKPTINKSEFDVIGSIKETLTILEPKLNCGEIKIYLDFSKTALLVYGYQKELNQVLINILINSADALFERGIKDKKISIKAYKKSENIGVVEIEDNAGGLDEKIKERAFDPYVSTKGDKGTGIGLYLSQKIIKENMGGDIELEDGEEGAIFRITFKIKS